MRLWLDDERPCPQGWVHARTAGEAIALLDGGQVVEVSLDHDLGPPEAGTGYDVVCHVEYRVLTEGFNAPVMRVHSANPVGRARMEAGIANIRRRV